MHHGHFLEGAAALAALPVSAASGRSLILLSEAEAARLKPGPGIADPMRWSRPRITPAGRSRGYCLGLAGMDTGRPEWMRMQRGFGIAGGAWGSLVGMVLEQWQN